MKFGTHKTQTIITFTPDGGGPIDLNANRDLAEMFGVSLDGSLVDSGVGLSYYDEGSPDASWKPLHRLGVRTDGTLTIQKGKAEPHRFKARIGSFRYQEEPGAVPRVNVEMLVAHVGGRPVALNLTTFELGRYEAWESERPA